MSVKRTKLYTASLKNPIFRFVTQADIIYNPHSAPQARHFYDRFVELARKYDKNKIQEAYIWSHKIIRERDLTIKNHCKLVYINETKLEFDFSNCLWNGFISHLRVSNEAILSERAIDGHDDEFEDDV